MAVAFCFLVSLANAVSLLVFRGGAVALLLLIWMIKIPSFIISCLLYAAGEILKRSVVLLFEFVKDTFTSDCGAEFFRQLHSWTEKLLQVMMSRVDEGLSIMFQNLKEVYEIMKCGCTFLSQFLPDVLESSWRTIIGVVSEILKNLGDSFKYFLENI